MQRNDPSVVAALQAAFMEYEQALRDKDLETLAAYFDEDADVVRFGIADRQRGPEELASWRAAQPKIPTGRMLVETTVTTFGTDYGLVSTLFVYPDRRMLGRQSQTWVRLGGGWKIVHAHVSEVAEDSLLPL
jgi:ketosteroid isomerase-like protein